jgi:gp16 family phage-associated protein
MKQQPKLKKPEDVRADFDRKGISIAAWARQHGVNRTLVYEILAGSPRRSCRRGQSHRVAVLLGLKDGVLGGVVGK